MTMQLNLGRLHNLLKEQTKVAETSKTEPTGNGATKVDHPTAKLDDGTVTPTEGERGKEMTTDVNKEPAAVGNASEPSRSTEGESKQVTLNLNATGVGRDASVEDNYGGTVKEPGVGTSSPAKFEDGEKYAAELLKLPLESQRQLQTGLANTIMAEILVDVTKTAAAAATPATSASPPAPAADTTPANQLIAEAQAGYDLASKTANEQRRGQYELAQWVEAGVLEGHLVGQHIKRAMDEAEAMSDEVTPSAPPEGKGPGAESASGPPPGKSETGESSGQDITQAIDALAGDPGAGGGMPPGAPPEMPGGPSGGTAGPAAGGGGMISIDALLQALAMAQMETGKSDAEVPGLMAPNMDTGMPGAQKVAADLVAFKRAGKFDSAKALKTADRRLVNHMRAMLTEQTR